jgi:hypothetical protein
MSSVDFLSIVIFALIVLISFLIAQLHLFYLSDKSSETLSESYKKLRTVERRMYRKFIENSICVFDDIANYSNPDEVTIKQMAKIRASQLRDMLETDSKVK